MKSLINLISASINPILVSESREQARQLKTEDLS
jgi:hypothetical protein